MAAGPARDLGGQATNLKHDSRVGRFKYSSSSRLEESDFTVVHDGVTDSESLKSRSPEPTVLLLFGSSNRSTVGKTTSGLGRAQAPGPRLRLGDSMAAA